MSQREFVLALVLLISSVGITAAQTSQPDPQFAIDRGNGSFAKEDYQSALREYRTVQPGAGEAYAQALYNIGVSYYELWRTAEAIDFYRRAIEVRDGRYPRASYALGVALEDQGQPAAAQAAYEQSIIASRGEYAPAHYRLGLLIAAQGNYQAAAKSFKKALSVPGPHAPASHNNLGVMLARVGRLTDARSEFEIALRQAGGSFDDAANNLKLCRSLLNASSRTEVASFKVSKPGEVPIK